VPQLPDTRATGNRPPQLMSHTDLLERGPAIMDLGA